MTETPLILTVEGVHADKVALVALLRQAGARVFCHDNPAGRVGRCARAANGLRQFLEEHEAMTGESLEPEDDAVRREYVRHTSIHGVMSIGVTLPPPPSAGCPHCGAALVTSDGDTASGIRRAFACDAVLTSEEGDPGTTCRTADPIAPYQITATAYPDQPEADTVHLMAVLTEIANERYRQDRQWGGPAHDDEHSATNWEGRLRKHAWLLTSAKDGRMAADYRDRLIKIAAIATAAAQSFDRLHPGAVSGAAACQEA